MYMYKYIYIYMVFKYIHMYRQIHIYICGRDLWGLFRSARHPCIVYASIQNINDLHAYKNFSRKLHFFFVAQPAQRPFSDPKEAVTSRGKRTLL